MQHDAQTLDDVGMIKIIDDSHLLLERDVVLDALRTGLHDLHRYFTGDRLHKGWGRGRGRGWSTHTSNTITMETHLFPPLADPLSLLDFGKVTRVDVLHEVEVLDVRNDVATHTLEGLGGID